MRDSDETLTKNDLFFCTMALLAAIWLFSMIYGRHFDQRLDRLERIVAPNRQAEIILSGL